MKKVLASYVASDGRIGRYAYEIPDWQYNYTPSMKGKEMTVPNDTVWTTIEYAEIMSHLMSGIEMGSAMQLVYDARKPSKIATNETKEIDWFAATRY